VSSFAIAFLVLPAEGRRAIRAVYAFCRRADDAVDEAAGPREGASALGAARALLEEAWSGTSADPVGRELAWAVGRFSLPRRPFEDLLEGVSWDLDGRRYADRDDLRAYCRRVASTVGLLCVRIFGCAGTSADRYADELGVALQWTNILRDVRTDLERGRLYLPADRLAAHGLTEADLRSPGEEARRRFRNLVAEEADFARARFAAAREALPAAERPRVVSGEIMAAVYRALLEKIARRPEAVLEGPPAISTPRRAAIALRVWTRGGA